MIVAVIVILVVAVYSSVMQSMAHPRLIQWSGPGPPLFDDNTVQAREERKKDQFNGDNRSVYMGQYIKVRQG